MRRIATLVAAVAVAGGLALGSAGVASATGGYEFQEARSMNGGMVYVYSSPGGGNHYSGLYYGSSWNGSPNAPVYTYYIQ